jgi:hypothetical protein
MIQVCVENDGVVARSIHAEGFLEFFLRTPADWTEPRRLDLADLLAREIGEVRIGCASSFTVVGEVVAWDGGRMWVRLTRRRVAGRLGPNAPSPLKEDVRVVLEGKTDEFRFLLETMIQAATDAPPGLIHRNLFDAPPSPPPGWEARVSQRCCARLVQENNRERLVVTMGLTHGPTGWVPFLRVARLDPVGLPRGETWLHGSPLGVSPQEWLAEACALAPVLARGFRRGQVDFGPSGAQIRLGERTLPPSLRALADRIQAGET